MHDGRQSKVLTSITVWSKMIQMFAIVCSKIPHFLKTDIFNQVADTLYWHWLVFMWNQVWLFVWCNLHQSWSWWNQCNGGTKAPMAVRQFSSVFPIAFCFLLLNPDHVEFQNVCPLFSRWYVTTQYDILVCQGTHYPLCKVPAAFMCYV